MSGWGAKDYNGTEVSLVLKDLKVNVLSNQECMEKAEEVRQELRQEPWARGDNLTQINTLLSQITIDRYDNVSPVGRYIARCILLIFYALQPACMCVGQRNTGSSSRCSLSCRLGRTS